MTDYVKDWLLSNSRWVRLGSLLAVLCLAIGVLYAKVDGNSDQIVQLREQQAADIATQRAILRELETIRRLLAK